MHGAPAGILSVHDSGPDTADRYTVFFAPALPCPDLPGYEGTGPGNTSIPYLTLNGHPAHPQHGVCLSGECKAYQRADYMRSTRKIRWQDLPAECRTAVLSYLS
jgi:hypothetical protein